MTRWLPDIPDDFTRLDELLDVLASLKLCVLTGAGCSTESGIPDYRGPKAKQRDPEPIRFQEFMASHQTRQRYWARSAVGWPRFKEASPNDAHRAIARLETAGIARGVITQNVDRLHHEAGSSRVVELHGALADVRCMNCDSLYDRDDMQLELRQRNPDWVTEARALHPDGDAELPEDVPPDYDIPNCPSCDGILKPDVVFFGENVRDGVVNRAWRLMSRSDALLVVGSSLSVYSGYRFVRRAADRRKPVAIVNLGQTRADDEAWVKLPAQAGRAMPRIADRLCK